MALGGSVTPSLTFGCTLCFLAGCDVKYPAPVCPPRHEGRKLPQPEPINGTSEEGVKERTEDPG